jgi:hypothetical protein
MKKIIITVFLLLFLLMPHISAEDVIFSVDQTEYYFLTGEQAIVPLTMNNTYNEAVDGLISYTITQTINQGGSSYSSSNSQSQSFSVPAGNNTIQINFGKSDQPLRLDVDLEFSFTKDNEDLIVSLNNIVIIFVSNQSQMNNQQNSMQSSSEKITNAEPDPNSQQQPQTPQDKLQNNQMNQDSQALKDQIERQLAMEQAQENDFEKNLFNNSEFQKIHESLQKQGYNLSNKQLDVKSNDTGSFNFTYENREGKSASFEGEMQDGELVDFQKQTAEDRQQLFNVLNQSKEFQEYHNQLLNVSYNRTSITYNQDGNITIMKLSYQNEENETAIITAEFFDKELSNVSLSKQKSMNIFFWIIPFIILLIVITVFVYYRYIRRDTIVQNEKKLKNTPFDYKKKAAELLVQAEKYFQKGDYKAAYAKAGQSLRLFLSYEHGLKKEITNSDIVIFLRNKKYPYNEIKQCFDVCSLVEFAKFQTNQSDFKRVYATVHSIIAQT